MSQSIVRHSTAVAAAPEVTAAAPAAADAALDEQQGAGVHVQVQKSLQRLQVKAGSSSRA